MLAFFPIEGVKSQLQPIRRSHSVEDLWAGSPQTAKLTGTATP